MLEDKRCFQKKFEVPEIVGYADCTSWHEKLVYTMHDGSVKLLNEGVNIFGEYIFGKQYIYSDVTGTQISCIGGTVRTKSGIDLPNVVVYQKTKIILRKQQLLVDGSQVTSLTDNTKIPCVEYEILGGRCVFDSITYSWNTKQSDACMWYVTKIVRGNLITMPGKKTDLPCK